MWQLPPPQQNVFVYRPEPILLVHGINDNDSSCWATIIDDLKPIYDVYQKPNALPINMSVQRSQQGAFVHTFNYGASPGVAAETNHNSRSFDHIEWNVFEENKNSLSLSNIYTKHVDVAPGVSDDRQTLDLRIESIQNAYASQTVATQQIILVAHSMGGLLAHYYLLKSSTDKSVRRLVTMATPHLGSPVANYLWDLRVVNPCRHWGHGMGLEKLLRTIRITPFVDRDEVGFATCITNGAIEDLITSDVQNESGCHLLFHNDLQTYFSLHQPPKTEYVFNTYHHSLWTGYQAFRVACGTVWDEADQGDGLVPVWSAAGKRSHSEPSIWNGPGGTPTHEIDPVIFGTWPNCDHSGASKHISSLRKSLDGVPYQWEGNGPTDWPEYARMYGENQSFKKYFSSPCSGSIAYTDEPGIDQMKVLLSRPGNPLLVNTRSTWNLNTGLPFKSFTNSTDIVGHQIIVGSSTFVTPICTVGVKNHSKSPIVIASYPWIKAGNEYLPASQAIVFFSDSKPIVPFTSATANGITDYEWGPTPAGGLVDHCLVEIDAGGNLLYQYGYYKSPMEFRVGADTNIIFISSQGINLAGLLTRQSEKVLGTPVSSAMVIGILKKINQGEVLSNGCGVASNPTPWQVRLKEWVKTDTGPIQLNFYPTTTNLIVVDTWVDSVAFKNFDFNANSKTITISDSNSAPSQIILEYIAYLGCANDFATNYDGSAGTSIVVSKLTAESLAGVPIDVAFLNTMRLSLSNIVSKYAVTTCGARWTFTNLLIAAGYTNGAWINVPNGLLLPAHFTQLKKVADQLIQPYSRIVLQANSLCAQTNLSVNTPWISYEGCSAPIAIVISPSEPPPGLTFTNDTAASISVVGIPTDVGSYSYNVTATGADGCTTNANCYILTGNKCMCYPCADTYTVSFNYTIYGGGNICCIDKMNALPSTGSMSAICANYDGCAWPGEATYTLGLMSVWIGLSGIGFAPGDGGGIGGISTPIDATQACPARTYADTSITQEVQCGDDLCTFTVHLTNVKIN